MIPLSLWIVMLFAAGVIFVFLLFFADPSEGAVTQGVLIGSVASVIAAMLLLLGFLDNPYREGPGSLQPVAMERISLRSRQRVSRSATRRRCRARTRG